MKVSYFIHALTLAGLMLFIPQVYSSQVPVETLVKTNSSIIKGVQNGDLLSWLGIPYAASPAGNLRWKPPVAPAKWSGVFQADKFGNFCPQNADLGVFGKSGGQEDCLNLNVYVSQTALKEGKKLPVLFWIHGGSLWVGAGRCGSGL